MKRLASRLAMAGVLLGGFATMALNPQPLPPGKSMPNTMPMTTQQCQQHESATGGAGAGKVRMMGGTGCQQNAPMMRTLQPNGPHRLNPQPLPPG